MAMLHVLAGRHAADGGLLRQAGGAAGAGRPTAGYIWLAVVAVLFSLVGAFYYLRVVKVMYFDEPIDRDHRSSAPADVRARAVGQRRARAVLGILPGGLMALCAQAIVKTLAT